jgi:hypothetical protein
LADYHLHYLKLQSKCEFFYWKSAGIFFVLSMAFFILQDYGFTLSPLIGVVIAGVGILLMLMQNIRMDFEYGIQAVSCVTQGLSIEEQYDYPPRLFKIFDDNKLIAYRGNLISRLFPMGIIALGTATAGTILALKVGTWLAVVVAIMAIVAIYAGIRSYLRITRKIMLGD